MASESSGEIHRVSEKTGSPRHERRRGDEFDRRRGDGGRPGEGRELSSLQRSLRQQQRREPEGGRGGPAAIAMEAATSGTF